MRASEQAGGGVRNKGKDTMTRLLMNLQTVESEMGNGDFTMSSRCVFFAASPHLGFWAFLVLALRAAMTPSRIAQFRAPCDIGLR